LSLCFDFLAAGLGLAWYQKAKAESPSSAEERSLLMALSFPEAVRVVENNPDALGVGDPYGYIANFKAFLRGRPDDARVAVLIAVDAAKSLIGVGAAFFVALSAFIVLFRSSIVSGFKGTLLFLMISIVLIILSIAAGLLAMGIAYRRGQRPADRNGAPWSTGPFSWLVGVQSLTGVGALALFGLAIAVWDGRNSGSATTFQFKALQGRIDSISSRVDQQVATLVHASMNPQVQAVQTIPPVADITPELRAIATSLDGLEAAIPRRININVTRTPPAPQDYRDSHAMWIRVQEALVRRGYWIGNVDGIPGKRTRKVIRTYQRTISASPTGYLTLEEADQLLDRH
jgi:Putative peptidoglycan binding domain